MNHDAPATIAIVGRPNVGKSTLFNRLVGQRAALVADQPGMTRDRHYAFGDLDGRRVLFVDTGGIETGVESESIAAQIALQAELAVQEADVIAVVFDSREGVTSADDQVVRAMRRLTKRPLVALVNKVERNDQQWDLAEFHRLGISPLLPISAEHGLGIDELITQLDQLLPERAEASQPDEDAHDELRVALIGRPNAGKSALFNRLAGEQRSIVSDVPGTTRDPVDVTVQTKRGTVTFVDTAGIRRKKRSAAAMEQLAALYAARAMARANVVCLLVDADAGISVQDVKLADAALQEGCALLVVLTKMDLVGSTRRELQQLKRQIAEEMPFATHVPIVAISAVADSGIAKLYTAMFDVAQRAGQRIATSQLNAFLEQVVRSHPPPSFHGKPVKLLYVTQVRTRPPQFVFSVSRPEGIGRPYRRYLENQLRKQFSFSGVPLRLFFRPRRRKK